MSDRIDMDRRRVLISLGAGVCGLSGCLSNGGTETDTQAGDESEDRPDNIICAEQQPDSVGYCGRPPEDALIVVEYGLSTIDASDVADTVIEDSNSGQFAWVAASIRVRKGSIGAKELFERTAIRINEDSNEDDKKDVPPRGILAPNPSGGSDGLTVEDDVLLENTIIDEGNSSQIYYRFESAPENPKWNVKPLIQEYGSIAIVPE